MFKRLHARTQAYTHVHTHKGKKAFHAVQLLTPAATLADTNGRSAISKTDLEEVSVLFRDAKFSARLLAEQADKYIH